MSDTPIAVPASSDEGRTANLIYILYLASLIVGVTALIGIVMAYIYRNEGPAWVQSHYRSQIRTFWIGLLVGVAGLVLTIVLVGWLILLGYYVWLIARCAKGMQYIARAQTHPNPTTWLF